MINHTILSTTKHSTALALLSLAIASTTPAASADDTIWSAFAEMRRAKISDNNVPSPLATLSQSTGSTSTTTVAKLTNTSDVAPSSAGATASSDSDSGYTSLNVTTENPLQPLDDEATRVDITYTQATENELAPIVYTRVPRSQGTSQVTMRDGTVATIHSPDTWDRLPDTQHVYDGFNAPGQLVFRNAQGSEKVIYDCMTQAEPCVPLDPAVSFDGKKILFSVYRSNTLISAYKSGVDLPNQWLGPSSEAQLHVYDVSIGKVTALPHQPGTRDVSPTWLPDGGILFSSDMIPQREPYLDRISSDNRPNPRLFIADANGLNRQLVTPHEVSTAMHPYVLRNGRVAYGSQWLSHNLAYIHTNGGVNWPGTLNNMWVVADMDARGGDMTSLFGAHRARIFDANGRARTLKALHFLGQRNNGDICVTNYYRGNNLGLGDVICWPPEPVGVEGALPNFTPRGLYVVANWSKSNDEFAHRADGLYLGKVGYPERAPNNQLFLTVGRGYCSQVSGSVTSFQERAENQPDMRACDVGLYVTTRIPSQVMGDMARIVDRPEWHEFGARMVMPRTVHKPAYRNTVDGSCQLTSSNAGEAETTPHKAYDFNNNYEVSANNGGEIDGLPHSDLAGVRFWQVIPNEDTKRQFINITGNQLDYLGDVSLLPDNSFKVELPCDTPYIMAGIDAEGRVIKRDQIPQSLRQGEKRVCTGCHLHSKAGRPYEQSMAFSSDPVPLLQPQQVPTYAEDVQPIFKRRCVACHSNDLPLMDYKSLVWDRFQEAVPTEKRLQVRDTSNEKRRYGLQRPYTSKYINSMFARESLLYWKAANSRTDGRTDETYSDDIDFGANHPTDITQSELDILGHWIDSGATYLEP